ncbi:apolipoprotein N-acyltransferase [Oryzihumus leptocrescens]|uniref:Apolipoprotein N-acyltransferase n=1 Tax=Oryzihumus leptocrescens TaxID=297536 RepID=A0A542ZIZ8_9MICO|nr:apolipoprotein N-acyltransferase [Oryzihumus leptocrescens]
MCRVHRYALALFAGLGLWLAFPSHDLWPLAPVGVALLALATRGAGPARGAVVGLVAGLACFLPLLSWSGIYVGAVPWVALSVLEALYVALLGAASGLLQSPRTLTGRAPVRPVVVALLWVAQEALRSATPFGGFPWGRLAFSQADSPLLHLAALAGAPAVTFGTALAGGLLAVAVARLRWEGPGRGIPVSGWLGALPALAGAVALTLAPALVPTPVDGPRAPVMAVQGNVPRAGLEFNAERRRVLDNHATVTHAAAASVHAGAKEHPDLVVWPENSSDIDPLRNGDAAAVINAAVDDIAAPVVVGAVLEEPSPRISNASLLYRPGVGVTQRYVKQHPVPFAEYIPYRSFFRHLNDKVDLVRSDMAPGPAPAVFRVPSRTAGTLAAGPVICFEVAYDGLVRETVAHGANLLLVQTNNATFGYTDESEQQLAISRVRAVEHGRSVVHVSTVGVSALITPDGVAHQRTTLFTAALLSGALPVRSGLTLADRVGAWPELLACAVVVLLLIARGRHGLRRYSRGDRTTSEGRT